MVRLLVFASAIVLGAAAFSQSPTAKPLTPEELGWLHSLYDRAHPPSLIGSILPEALRSPEGGVTVAVIMASSCPHCAKEVPYLAELAGKAKPEAHVLPVFFERDERAAAFLSGLGWDRKPVLLAEAAAPRIKGTPTTLVAGPDGKVTAEYEGELQPAQKAELERLVSQ